MCDFDNLLIYNKIIYIIFYILFCIFLKLKLFNFFFLNFTYYFFIIYVFYLKINIYNKDKINFFKIIFNFSLIYIKHQFRILQYIIFVYTN